MNPTKYIALALTIASAHSFLPVRTAIAKNEIGTTVKRYVSDDILAVLKQEHSTAQTVIDVDQLKVSETEKANIRTAIKEWKDAQTTPEREDDDKQRSNKYTVEDLLSEYGPQLKPLARRTLENMSGTTELTSQMIRRYVPNHLIKEVTIAQQLRRQDGSASDASMNTAPATALSIGE